jgi:hypothetical protein
VIGEWVIGWVIWEFGDVAMWAQRLQIDDLQTNRKIAYRPIANASEAL